MVHLTDPQRKVAEYILDHIKECGTPPTLREIAHHLGWSAVGSAQDVVAALRRKGVLQPSEPGKARQIVPSPQAAALLSGGEPSASSEAHPKKSKAAHTQPAHLGNDVLWVPLVGQVAAGHPTEAIESSSDRVPFFYPQAVRKDPSNFFSLRVEGYSMMNCGFLPGDYLLVERHSTARNGDIVVATIDSAEATVKRFAARGSDLYCRAMETLKKQGKAPHEIPPALLVPENPMFEPMPFGLKEGSRVIGLVRALQRPVVA